MDSPMQQTREMTAEIPTHKRIMIIAILFLTIFIAYIDRVNVSVLVVDNNFLTDMGIIGQPVQMGMLMSTFLIAYGVGNFLLSPIGDYLGPRKAMSLAILFWALSLYLSGFASLFSIMIACRIILGLGEGLHYPMQSKYVKNWFPPQERGKANTCWLLGQSAAPAIAMPLITWMIHAMNWRMSFFILATAGLVPLVLLWFCTTDFPRQHKGVNKLELDYIEEGLKKENEIESKLGKTTFWENIKLYIFNYRVWLMVLYWCCNNSIWWGMMAWLPSYLKVVKGFTLAQMGALASLPFILSMLIKCIAGFFVDKVGRGAPFLIGAMLCSAAGVYFGAYAEDRYVSTILISFGIGAISIGTPAAFTVLQKMVPTRAVGGASGLMNGVANVVSGFAPMIIGVFIGFTGSYSGGLMFIVAAGLVGACMGTILTVLKW